MTHPALLMLKIWAVCILLYTVLPFHLIDRSLTIQGFVILFLFLATFCAGTLIVKKAKRTDAPLLPQQIDFSTTEILLSTASIVTIVALLLDLRDKSVFDLAVSYELRSDQATALMEGALSSSSVWFKIGFLTYPAAYVYLVRTIIFEARPKSYRLVVFGFLPVLLATVAMGGRSPLLYAILISFFAVGTRKVFLRRQNPMIHSKRQNKPKLGVVKAIGIATTVLGAMYYFVAVFFTRAETVGGAANMFNIAEEIWGIGFTGTLATFMFQVLGEELTFIIFIFIWYVVQGLVMANILFSDYSGPMQWGMYGVDLVSALLRRLDGALVARNFESLQQLGIYGFLPSAFGSLYVDLWFFGLGISAVWGMLAGLVYQRIKAARDSRWLLFAPFVSTGILFSLMNTPIGFSNGLVTHAWMLVAFLTSTRLLSGRRVTLLAENPT